MKTKHALWEKYKVSRQQNDYKMYCVSRNKVTCSVRNAKKELKRIYLLELKMTLNMFGNMLSLRQQLNLPLGN